MELGQHLTREEHDAWMKAVGAKGWLAGKWPKEHGGLGWSHAQAAAFQEELGKAGTPSLVPFGMTMVGPVIYTFGTHAQKASPHFSPGVCRQPVEQLVVATAGLDVLHRVLWARDHAHQLVQATFWFISALAAINIL